MECRKVRLYIFLNVYFLKKIKTQFVAPIQIEVGANFPGMDADRAAVATQQEVVVMEQQSEEQEMVEAQTAVVSVVDAASQEVLQQVHFTVEVDGATQEQQVRRCHLNPVFSAI